MNRLFDIVSCELWSFSIKFRKENELMEKDEAPGKYDIEAIVQEKIKLYL